MTVEEMVELLLRHAIPDRVFGRNKYDEIIEALKAGQRMRDAIMSNWAYPRRLEESFNAAQVWDAVTKKYANCDDTLDGAAICHHTKEEV